MWQDFKGFISQGNVVDLAVAVVIGAAFGQIISSLVDDIIMPFVGVLLGGKSFANLVFTVGEAQINYGTFIQSVVDFFIIGASIFFFVRLLHSFRRKAEEEEIDEQTELLKEIRDLLSNQK